MADSTGQTNITFMRSLEDKLNKMRPQRREAFIDSYLDWLSSQALDLAKSSDENKKQAATHLWEVFITGAKQPDEGLLRFIQETALVAAYIIGDPSGEDFGTRTLRALQRRTRVMNIWRAAQGLEPLPPPKLSEPMQVEDMIRYHELQIEELRGKRVEPQKATEEADKSVKKV